ncbi:hypothetical protein V8C37DRAFT_217323 [Trichoderma ceciliae]
MQNAIFEATCQLQIHFLRISSAPFLSLSLYIYNIPFTSFTAFLLHIVPSRIAPLFSFILPHFQARIYIYILPRLDTTRQKPHEKNAKARLCGHAKNAILRAHETRCFYLRLPSDLCCFFSPPRAFLLPGLSSYEYRFSFFGHFCLYIIYLFSFVSCQGSLLHPLVSLFFSFL